LSRLYAITDRRIMGPDPLAAIRALCARYGRALSVQIREKDLSARVLHDWVAALVSDLNGAQLLVNGRADVARCFEGVGVHLPEDGLTVEEARRVLGPERPIGASAHSAADAIARRREGADLVTLSPVFETPGKGTAIGLEPLREAAHAGGIYALGGITKENVDQVRATGVEGIAAIRAIWSSEVMRYGSPD
jgi:thiamine-phosphate pyrophosphorylase